MTMYWSRKALRSFSPFGLLLGTLFFAASLTPSLIPRETLIQGLLSGLSFSIGYGIGVLGKMIWEYLQLPQPEWRWFRLASIVAVVISAAIALISLWKASGWQDSIRALMGMQPVDSVRPIQVALITIVVFVLLVLIARLFALIFRVVASRLRRYVPPRVAGFIGGALTIVLFWTVVDGLLLRYALRVMDSSFERVDAMIDADIAPPSDPMKTGSAASLVDWEGIGRQGRDYVVSGPSQAAIAEIAGEPAKEPLRVYVGLNSADTAEARAKLALDELIRVGGFDRSVLVMVTPTGTGWVDPAAIDPVEFLHHGDIASIAIQYSYLPSWLSLLVQPGYGSEASRALFAEVYGYWTKLPKDHRPKLYLFGLSLGAMNSDLSHDLFDVIADPYQGALWSGAPFTSRTWRDATDGRVPGSPAWLPRFRDGSVIRFTGQKNSLGLDGAPWGPMRIVFLQYASDAITFFSTNYAFWTPEWMIGERGPDVSPDFRWIPIVTFLQLGIDLITATTTPMGYGHVYAPEHYVDSWIAVTDPQGWTPEAVEKLKAHFIGMRKDPHS
ncbi:MAG: alpha/beta-hydrolase family protein [Rhizobiaceae bacterium]|nr:alpha/beta-hydrolase family protein [Rhizobiaceae bacterium]